MATGSPIRVAFAGSPDFSVPTLAAINQHPEMSLSLVVTQPDKRSGRGQRLKPNPVKSWCIAHGVSCYQPHRSGQEFADLLLKTRSDFLVVVAFGQILPQVVLDAVSGRCLNVHASLLPRWRGAAPVQSAILAGDKKSGVCIMQMQLSLDSGPVLTERKVSLDGKQAGEVLAEMSVEGANALIETLLDYPMRLASARIQDERFVTWAKKVKKVDTLVDWSQTSEVIARCIRAYGPNPAAYSWINQKRVKLVNARGLQGELPNSPRPGTVVSVTAEGVTVATGQGALLVTSLQLAGASVIRFDGRTVAPAKVARLAGLIFQEHTP